jgi:hypothetical protein
MNLNQAIKDTFQVLSLILVFVTLLFTLRYKEIVEDISKEVPEGERARNREKKRLRTSILTNCLPSFLLSGISFYLFLPLSITIIKSSKIELWNFDFLATAFILITFCVGSFFIWSSWLGIRLLWKVRSINI